MVVPKHGVHDEDKLATLVEAMENGWPEDMPPVLVTDDDEALTGSHRIAAARIAGIEPETLNVQDAVEALYEEGYDWEELMGGFDDEDLAAAFRLIGREDLARMAA